MSNFARSPITAVLGPTNTGKTHLAVERLCAHASGIMGFPLRLLAREIYDRVVAIKGEALVGLITGEEKILPKTAKYLLTTVESMPMEQQAAFVAVDEVQLGSDPERGHVFTDRLLRARGYAETMFLGSDTMGGLVRKLVPDAEIISRPRFSTLTYAGHKKLSRLPRRSAIVAFSAEEVYAIAEALRRLRGGAAVVMGALSPRTRNAQVAMFQAGEVDYLVATDAIGMGLNLNVNHVAFASLHKFDGRRLRRLTIAEMAQIAGRAGRHQQDGTFGTVGNAAGVAFTPEEIEAIEEHRFPRLDKLYWRRGDPVTDSIDTLIDALEEAPDRPDLMPAPQAIDLAVLKRLADEPDVRSHAHNSNMVARLWDVCGVPDFLKMGPDHHARFVHRLWQYRSGQNGGGLGGHVDGGWFADQLARLDRTDGDVETLSARIAGVRTWCYIAHRPGWLLNAEDMAIRARLVEARLSDALHERLTQRFVDRRTSVLLRSLGENNKALAVTVTADNAVLVEGEEIGSLHGFRFVVDKAARASDHRLLLASAEKHLSEEYAKRAAALAEAPDNELVLKTEPDTAPILMWQDDVVAELVKGGSLLAPTVQIDRNVRGVTNNQQQDVIRQRLTRWVEAQIATHLGALAKTAALASDANSSAALRGFLAPFADQGGILPRMELDSALAALTPEDRAAMKPIGLLVGSLDLFQPAVLKPEPARWRMALMALWHGEPMGTVPTAGAVRLVSDDPAVRGGAKRAGFRSLGPLLLRIDMIERVARHAHEARVKAEAARPPSDRRNRVVVALDPAFATSLGLDAEAYAKLLSMLGFRRAPLEVRAEEVAQVTETTENISGEAPVEISQDIAGDVQGDAVAVSDAPADKDATPEAEATLETAPETNAEIAATGADTVAAEPAMGWAWHGRVKEHHGRDRKGPPRRGRANDARGERRDGGRDGDARKGRPSGPRGADRDGQRSGGQRSGSQRSGGYQPSGRSGASSAPPRALEHSPFAALAALLPAAASDTAKPKKRPKPKKAPKPEKDKALSGTPEQAAPDAAPAPSEPKADPATE